MKNIVIVPGWMATEQSDWMPWLISEITKRGIPHRFCPLPHQPVPITWTAVRRLRRMAAELSGPQVIICHSFGGKVVLKALSEGKISVDALIMVAPLYRWPLTDKVCIWRNYVDFAKLKENCGKIYIIHSSDDKLVPFNNGAELARRCVQSGIPIEMCPVNGKGHFDRKNNCLELPEVLQIYDMLCAST